MPRETDSNVCKPLASIVTVSYNSARTLERYWSPPPSWVEWIVVDNASTDHSQEVAASLGARVISLTKNVGFGRATNVGVQSSTAAVVGAVNPDVRVEYDDLELLVERVSAVDGIIAPQLLNPDGSPQPNGRGWPSLANKILNRLAPDLARGRQFQRFANPGERIEVVSAIGAAIFMKRSIATALGPFDPRFFVYYEDIDLCLRARSHGLPTFVDGDFRWTHEWARSASGANFRGWSLELDGLVRFYSRYPALLVRR